MLKRYGKYDNINRLEEENANGGPLLL